MEIERWGLGKRESLLLAWFGFEYQPFFSIDGHFSVNFVLKFQLHDQVGGGDEVV